MDYTITINPENWRVFKNLKPLTFGFRPTVIGRLKKIQVGDRLIVYLAQNIVWAGAFEVTTKAYSSDELLYPGERSFTLRLEVKPIVLLNDENYVPIKKPELWNSLNWLRDVDHSKSGWIYKASLTASLSKLTKTDADTLIQYLQKEAKK
jgi:hypothetical protein